MKKKQRKQEVEDENNCASKQKYFDIMKFEEENAFSIADLDEDKPLVEKNWAKPERNLFILFLDAVLLLIEYLQIFAVLQSLSLRWTWPVEWTRSMSFLFIFNLDVWELAKLTAPGVYIPARNYLVDSVDVPVNYRLLLLFWLLILIFFCTVYFVLRKRFNNHLQYNHLYKLNTVALIALQILALPVAVQIGKIFWCRVDGKWDVENSLTCWSGEHIAYAVICVVVAIMFYLIYPALLAWHISKQVITSDSRKHEMYMRLKHCEYLYGLNSSWNDQLYFMFASFRRFWVFERPVAHFLKFIIICFYAGGFSNRLIQISCIFGILLLWLIASLIRLPYRVSSYNFPHAWNLACLTSCAVIGTMQNIEGIQSVFLLPDYILGELILINVAWFVGNLLWIIFIVLRIKNLLCRRVILWPTLMKMGRNGVSENTPRYIVACVEAKKVLEQANSVPALLSPVHLLSHHIKVLNALACEAEHIRDPLHSTLRDILDDVMQLHNKLVDVSIFTESVQSYVQNTIGNLVEMLPAFSKRLHQRDFDLILTTPVRRRMLLKMFAVSCFLRAGRQAGAHDAGVRKLWKPISMENMILDEGFHEESENFIALQSINLLTAHEDRPLSIASSRKSNHAVSLVEESAV